MSEPSKAAMRAAERLCDTFDVGDHSGPGGCNFDRADAAEVAALIDRETAFPELLAIARRARNVCTCVGNIARCHGEDQTCLGVAAQLLIERVSRD